MCPAHHRPRRRDGKVLVLLALAVPMLIAVMALVTDGGMLASQQGRLQHAADAAAITAAAALQQGESEAQAIAAAEADVASLDGFADPAIAVHIPPTSGPHVGEVNFVEVIAEVDQAVGFMRILDGAAVRRVSARSTAAFADATEGAAIVVLDPDPASFSAAGAGDIVGALNVPSLVNQLPLGGLLSGLGLSALLNSTRSATSALLQPVVDSAVGGLTLPALPALIAGLEVEGVGRLIVDGTILVNTQWGGVDERSNLVGDDSAPPYAVACMPLLPTSRIVATDVRVAGGVDDPDNFRSLLAGGATPLRAGRLPVPDPLADVPVPSTSADPSNVSAVVRGGHVVKVNVLSVGAVMQPLLGGLWAVLKPTVETALGTTLVAGPLQPGVYDSLTVLSLGQVEFEPGVYIIRGRSPITQMSLAVLGGWIEADGVMFYVTDNAGFSASTGAPDAAESSENPPTNGLSSALPSVLLAPLLPGSDINGLDDPTSPFHRLVLYQRRNDRRPIVIAATQLVGGGQISGIVYNKWGHVAFVGGSGSYDLSFVCGTMRVVTAFDTTLAPTEKLPPAKDVFLVE
jgi:hypothetical protein